MKKWKCALKAVVAVSMVCLLSTQVYATPMDDAQQDKEEAEDNKDDAQQVLDGLENEKSNLEARVVELDNKMAEIQTRISDLNAQKADLEVQIADKQAQLVVAKEDEAQQYAAMCARIQFMYENDSTNYADALLSSGSMSDMLNQPEYVSAMADYDYNMLEELVATREQIANDEQQLQMDLRAVEQLTTQVQEEEAEVNALIAEKEEEINEYEDMISRQKQIVAQCEAELQAAKDKIAQLNAEAMGNSSFVPYEGGALVWPVPSSTRVTSPFGYRSNPFGGSSGEFHPSIDIGAPGGTPIVAAASGVVVISKYSSSAGEWIVISHGNGMYTSYMHGTRNSRYVGVGDYVSAGQNIMLVGTTGRSTGNHLDFGVWQGWPGYGSYVSYSVDPMSFY